MKDKQTIIDGWTLFKTVITHNASESTAKIMIAEADRQMELELAHLESSNRDTLINKGDNLLTVISLKTGLIIKKYCS